MPLFRCCRPKITNYKPCNSDLDTSGSCLRNLCALERRIQENSDENSIDSAKHHQQQQQQPLVKTLLENGSSWTNRSLCFFQKWILAPNWYSIEDWNSKKSPSGDQHRSNNKDEDNQTKSNCDFEFIDLRFWETFGFIGIAMVVGLRSRLGEFAQYRRDRTTDNPPFSDPSFIFSKNSSSCPSCSIHNYGISSFNCGPSCQWYRSMFNKLVGSFHCLQSIPRMVVEDGQSTSNNIIEINNNHIHFDPDPSVNDEKDHHHHHLRHHKEPNILDEDDDLLIVFQKAQTSSSSIKEEQNNYHQIAIGKDQGSDFSIDESISISSSSCISTSTSEISEAESDQNNDDDNDDLGAFLSKTLIEYCDHVNNLNAIQMMTNHRPEEAMKLWSNCQETSSTSLFNMGVAYESGRYATTKTATLQNFCGKPDMDLAYYYYAMAAMKGHPKAIYNLALYHLYGKGRIKQNIERGLKILRLASKQGVGEAEKFLRKLDENSEKLPPNFLQSSRQQQQQQGWILYDDWREIPSKTTSSLSWMFTQKNRSKSEPNLNTIFNHGHNQLHLQQQNIFM